MQTILGPFHPHLENALVGELLKYKQADPLCPLLILVPSDVLRRRVKILLAREHNLSLTNLHILTFHQLSLRLFAEPEGIAPPILADDLFLEEVLRQIISTRQPGTEPFAGIEERAGGCGALWQTLRDLRDGMVDPAVALEAVGEGHFAARAGHRIADLLALFESLLAVCGEKNIHDQSDIVKVAIRRAAESNFLKQFRRIFYYGFYDLTQIQLDFFQAVSCDYPTTLLFPLLLSTPAHDGWSFAERFYERYLRGRGGDDIETNLLTETKTNLPLSYRIFDQDEKIEYHTVPAEWRCRVLNCFGLHDEISVVAKEILRLASDENMAFDEIGVVARTLDPYAGAINEVFAQHQIPIAGTIEAPLMEFPLAKAAVLLFNLPAKDYLRSHVIDLLSSPYFQLNDGGSERGDPRPDLWDLATRELGISRGVNAWERLERHAGKGLVLFRGSDDDDPRAVKIPARELRALGKIVKSLTGDLGSLPEKASWSEYAARWKDLLKKYLAIAPDPSGNPMDSATLVRNRIVDALDRMAALDAVSATVSLAEFTRIFERWLERSTVGTSEQNIKGVAVLNAAQARGLSFCALFIVGMNEGLFPRAIREDAFLRDRDRDVLERDLGYKVSQKLAGFDEEKLLFTLLVNSARERLYCSFQRADESGRTLAPSWYVAELKRRLVTGNQAQLIEETIPRSIKDKTGRKPFDREDLLLPPELAISLSLEGKDPLSLIETAKLSPALFKQGLKTLKRLDFSTDQLDAFDGIIKSLDHHWRRVSERGLSPTALEAYARCPFQYFARQILGLERLETPEDSFGPNPAQFGELGHLILKLTYQELIERGYFTGNASMIRVDSVLKEAAREAFAQYEANNPVGYPLVWETIRDALTGLIREVLNRDLQELSESGYVPMDVETDVAHCLPPHWPEPLNNLKIRGRMDRIDIDPLRNRIRIVDYKFKFGGKPSPEDNSLSRSALRGQRLQPPFYSWLAKAISRGESSQAAKTEVEASFYYIAPRWNGGPLITQTFRELSGKLAEEITQTIAELANGIQRGHFFMEPGEYCPHCEVAEICRKNHPPSVWRAEMDPTTARHRELRKKDPAKL